jgi:hypothetical protein
MNVISRIVAFMYGTALCVGLWTLANWYIESRQPVVVFDDNPGYRILEITDQYIEIKWVKARLVTNCPGRVEPIFVGEYASHSLPSYPFIVSSDEKTFSRRYEIPKYFRYADYELRINMIAVCNPLFETRQVLVVPFRYDPKNLLEYH